MKKCASQSTRPKRRPSLISMHEHVPVWHDSCSCEAEPYWVEAMEETQTAPGQTAEDEAETGCALRRRG